MFLVTGVGSSSSKTWPGPPVTLHPPDMSDQEQAETTKLVTMAAEKKIVVSDTGLCNFWALTWLVAWYIFSGHKECHSPVRG